MPPHAVFFDQKVAVKKTFAYFQSLPHFNNHKHSIYEQTKVWNIFGRNPCEISNIPIFIIQAFPDIFDTFTVGIFYHFGNNQNQGEGRIIHLGM